MTKFNSNSCSRKSHFVYLAEVKKSYSKIDRINGHLFTFFNTLVSFICNSTHMIFFEYLSQTLSSRVHTCCSIGRSSEDIGFRARQPRPCAADFTRLLVMVGRSARVALCGSITSLLTSCLLLASPYTIK